MKRLLLFAILFLCQLGHAKAQIDNGVYRLNEPSKRKFTYLTVYDNQYILEFIKRAGDGYENLVISAGVISESDSIIHFVDLNNAIRLEMIQDEKSLRVLSGFSHLLGKTFCLWNSITYDEKRFEDLFKYQYETGDSCLSAANNKDVSVETADSLRMRWYHNDYYTLDVNLRIRSDRTYTLSVDTCMISEGTWLSGFDDLFLIDSNSCIYYHLKIRKEKLVPCSNNTRIPQLYLIQEFTRPPKLPKLWPDH